MARLIGNNGLSNFSGKFGTIVGGSWNGIQYIRCRPDYKKHKPTEKQILNQQRFRFANSLVHEFREFFYLSFEKEFGQSQASSAMKCLLNGVIVGEHPNLSVDYNKLLVAKGSLPAAAEAVANSGEPGMINFSWVDNSNHIEPGKYPWTHHSILVAYSEEMKELMYDLNGPRRAVGAGSLKIPAFFGKEVHTWISFRSADHQLKANSVYTGLIEVIS